MQKRKFRILFAVIFILSLGFFMSFRFYWINNDANEGKMCFVRKINNQNTSFNLLKANASSIIKTGDLVVYKDPVSLDPPYSKRDNNYSRVIAKPGELFSLNNADVFINDELLEENYKLYFLYRISMDEPTNFIDLLEGYDLKIVEVLNKGKACNFLTTQKVADKLSDEIESLIIRKVCDRSGWGDLNVFPKQNIAWNKDFWGPIVIPHKGQRVTFNNYTISIYKRIIDAYEGHKLYVSGDKVFIDDIQVNDYVIEKDYYLVLDDNRFKFNDSRSWGFLPEDFIVAKILN